MFRARKLNSTIKFLFYREKGIKLAKAIRSTVSKDLIHTADLGGIATTEEVIQNILLRLI